MPNRIIRESCRTSKTLNDLSDFAERLFWRLTVCADDYGRFEAEPAVILAQCFPLRVERLKIATIKKAYAELEACGLVTTYAVKDKTFGFFNTWHDHQRTRAKQSKYPAPSSDNICQQMTSDSADLRPTTYDIKNDLRPTAERILTFLNDKANRNYRSVPANLDFIIGRLTDGATEGQCRQVIVRKCRAWRDDKKMADYLRPATLFNKTKFEQYVGELVVTDDRPVDSSGLAQEVADALPRM